MPRISIEENCSASFDVPRFVKLLQARFSEEGSNSRTEKEKVYRAFVNYLKEVSGE